MPPPQKEWVLFLVSLSFPQVCLLHPFLYLLFLPLASWFVLCGTWRVHSLSLLSLCCGWVLGSDTNPASPRVRQVVPISSVWKGSSGEKGGTGFMECYLLLVLGKVWGRGTSVSPIPLQKWLWTVQDDRKKDRVKWDLAACSHCWRPWVPKIYL